VDVRRQHGELRATEDTFRVLLHKLRELQRSELSVQVDDRADANELRLGVIFQDGGEDVCDEVDTLLLTPAADEDEQLSLGVDLETCPFLSLDTECATGCLVCFVDLDFALLDDGGLVPVCDVAWVGVGKLSDAGETPENCGVVSKRRG
jgi:hypothetical protein